MSISYSWQQILWLVIRMVPVLIVWAIAIMYCFSRYRENPKGALFLGMAIAIAFASRVTVYLLPYFYNLYFSGSGMGMSSWFMMLFNGAHALSQVAIWILIIMAVFARPMHYDFTSGPMFDDERS